MKLNFIIRFDERWKYLKLNGVIKHCYAKNLSKSFNQSVPLTFVKEMSWQQVASDTTGLIFVFS